MVSSELFLPSSFDCKTGPFAGISILVCGNFFQLPPIKGKLVIVVSGDRLDRLKSHDLWQIF